MYISIIFRVFVSGRVTLLFCVLRPSVLCQFWRTPTPAFPFTHKKCKGIKWYRGPRLGWLKKGSLGWFRVLPLLSFRWSHSDFAGFISSDSAQSMMCTEGRIHYGLKIVFCLMRDTPSRYHHHADVAHLHWAHTVKDYKGAPKSNSQQGARALKV